MVEKVDLACRTFTGAWIETCMIKCFGIFIVVAPSRVRGLKHLGKKKQKVGGMVAPSRVRGLKPL